MQHHYYVLIMLWSILLHCHIISVKQTCKLATDTISISQMRKLNDKAIQHIAWLVVREQRREGPEYMHSMFLLCNELNTFVLT